ncbi:Uncharacterised protein [uncultured archaeon]|nr:Uncharacterised protein [uncultured archaeon]
MRIQYVILLLLFAFLAGVAIVLGSMVYLLAPANAPSNTSASHPASPINESYYTTTTIAAPTNNTGTPQNQTTSSFNLTTQTSTTTTNQPPPSTSTTNDETLGQPLRIEISGDPLYRGDDVRITVVAGNKFVSGAQVTVDGTPIEATDDQGETILSDAAGGNHTITAEKTGHASASTTISVYPIQYGLSPAVKVHRTEAERQELIKEGKVVFIFYDRPNCPNCMRMKPWAAAIAARNRDCVAYELLSIINDAPRDEVKQLYPDQSTVDTPVLVFEGPQGRYVSDGFMPQSAMENRVSSVSGGRCLVV